MNRARATALAIQCIEREIKALELREAIEALQEPKQERMKL